MKKLTFFVCLGLAGCFDRVIETKQISEPREIVDEQSCTTTGYCFTCMPGMDMKMDCKFKFSAACDGTEKVRILVADFKYTHQSGRVRFGTETIKLLETVEQCSL